MALTIPAFMTVPPMMPRPLLRDFFHLTYRKIPVLAIGRDVYCDTSIILEALEHIFCDGFRTLYPPAADGRTNRALIRGFASYWTDVRSPPACCFDSFLITYHRDRSSV